MKEYQKPEFELITLVAQEKITTDSLGGNAGIVDGEMDMASSIF